MNKFLTTTEAAKALGVSRNRVCVMAATGTIKAEKFGRDYRICAAAVQQRLKNPPPPGRKKGFKVKPQTVCRICGEPAIGSPKTPQAKEMRGKLADRSVYPTEPQEKAAMAYCVDHALRMVFLWNETK